MARQPVVVVAVVLVALGACLQPAAHAIDFGFGPCPHKEVVRDFDVGRYMGDWYELERFWQVFELNGKCVTARYSFNATSGRVSVKNSMVDAWTKQEKSIEGFAVLDDPTANPVEAKLSVTFKIPLVGNQKAPYWVLATDYNNYALVYACTSRLNIRAESAWILARQINVTDAVRQDIEDAIAAAGLNRKSFQKTVHDCVKKSPLATTP